MPCVYTNNFNDKDKEEANTMDRNGGLVKGGLCPLNTFKFIDSARL